MRWLQSELHRLREELKLLDHPAVKDQLKIRALLRGLGIDECGISEGPSVAAADSEPLSAADLLSRERKQNGWTIKQQVHEMGLDRADFYRALKGTLPPNSVKASRFEQHIKHLLREN